MSQAEDIDKVVAVLEKVPEKKLFIIELVNQVPLKGRELDYDELAKRQTEVNLAITEAKVYGAHTVQAVDALVRVVGQEPDLLGDE